MEKDYLMFIKNGLKEQLKEDFRQFLIDNGVADQCVLDSSTYSKLSSIVGCFKYGGLYFVYNTDERSEYFDIQRHERQIDAYRDVASRFNLEYAKANEITK